VQPLSEDNVNAALARLDGWIGDTTGITRTVSLPTFPAAIAVVDQIAVAAEAANHHPDIDIRWRKLTIRLSTHSAGDRVTGLDTALASQIDEIVGNALG
jgi:4a-hydroxytetrahydrobiopterin dehydratase